MSCKFSDLFLGIKTALYRSGVRLSDITIFVAAFISNETRHHAGILLLSQDI
jgi:hypothetical protein